VYFDYRLLWVHCRLKYQHWPMKLSFLTRKVVSGILHPCKLDKCNAQKLEITTNINVYSYRRAHRRASCSAGVICRDCGVVICNTQPSIYFFLAPPNTWNSYSCHIVASDLFCSHCRGRSYLSRKTFLNCASHSQECK